MIDARAFSSAMRANRYPRELCMQPIPWDAAKLAGRVAIEPKYDGFRVIGAMAELQTREGVPVACCEHLIPGLRKLSQVLFGLQTVFDAEYVHPDGVNAAIGDFRRARGEGGLFVFDAVPLDVWLGRAESEPLAMRRRRLETGRKLIEGTGVYLATHAVLDAPDDESVEIAAGVAWDQGLEGIVVKDLDSPYVRAASPAWMKLKRVETIDSQVFDVDVDSDGRLRALHVNAGTVERPKHVRLARGFSNAERELNRSHWIGAIVEWKHYGETEKGAFKSATYLRRRDDKMGRK